jgi:hypothetical protein
MSFTFGDVQASVQARGYQSDTAAQQLTIAQSVARRVYAMRRWPFLEGSATANTVAGTPTVALPAGVDRVDAVRLTFGTDYTEPDYLPYNQVRDLAYKDRTTDTPAYWTLGPGETSIYFFPTPDRAYTVDFDTIRAPTIPADAVTALPYLPDTFRDVLAAGSCAEVASRQRDWNAANYWTGQFQTLLAEQVKSYGLKQRQSPREVSRWVGWEDVER